MDDVVKMRCPVCGWQSSRKVPEGMTVFEVHNMYAECPECEYFGPFPLVPPEDDELVDSLIREALGELRGYIDPVDTDIVEALDVVEMGFESLKRKCRK